MLKYFFKKNSSGSAELNYYSNKWFCLGVPLLISLLLKMVLLCLLHDGAINADGTLYIRAARNFAAGNFSNGLALYPMPAYPFLITVTHMIIPDWILAGYTISIASMVLASIPLFYLVKHMFGMRSAFWACLVFAFLPKMNDWALYISRDALYLLLFSWCVYLSLRSVREVKASLFWLTFILSWLSILIRIEGVTFVVFYFGVLVRLGFTNKKEKIRYFSRAFIWAGIPLCLAIMALLSFGSHGVSVNRFNQVFLEFFKLFNGDFLDHYFQIYRFFSEAEHSPPFSGLHYNFAALARHYLFLIYSMGMAEALIKIIFPLSCIPLYIGLKDRMTFSLKFIIGLWIVNVLVVYYTLLTRDYISTRFLMVPAFLLLPWIGNGINKLCEKTNGSPRKAQLSLLILCILAAPAIKSFDGVFSNDNATPSAVDWLAENNMLNKTDLIVTNDKKLSFYVEIEREAETSGKEIYYFDDPDGTEKIEKLALKNNADILVINLHTRKINKVPDYTFYKKVHTVLGDGDIVQIYRLNNIHGAQGGCDKQ